VYLHKYTLWVKKKLDRLNFSFERNVRKHCRILIISFTVANRNYLPTNVQLNLPLQKFSHSLLLHYLEKCNHIHFFTETAEWNSNARGNFVVVIKQEILVISLNVFFDAASRRHDDVTMTSYWGHTVFTCLQGQAAHAQRFICCVKKCQNLVRPTGGLQTAQISVLCITRSGQAVMHTWATNLVMVRHHKGPRPVGRIGSGVRVKLHLLKIIAARRLD